MYFSVFCISLKYFSVFLALYFSIFFTNTQRGASVWHGPASDVDARGRGALSTREEGADFQWESTNHPPPFQGLVRLKAQKSFQYETIETQQNQFENNSAKISKKIYRRRLRMSKKTSQQDISEISFDISSHCCSTVT